MPAEVVLMMDLAGVLTTSPFPAARRLAEAMMYCVFERAGAHLTSKLVSQRSVGFLARQYSNFFYTVIEFTERVRGCGKGAFAQLELGEMTRLEFIPAFTAEIDVMLRALTKHNVEELEHMGIAYPKRVASLRRRFPLLCDPIIQVLVRQLLDVEAFLCTVEKVSPRKNVLNLLHYLRMRSQQEIRLFAMGNSWETEGQYRRMLRASATAMGDSVAAVFPVACPVEYGNARNSSFNVNGLFDGYVQSHFVHKRKPYPDIFLDAIDEVMQRRMPTGEALRYDLKPYIFYFDDVAAHCEVARALPGSPFTEVYLVEDGAQDVYHEILSALKMVAARDAFWANVVAGVEKDIAPLFHSSASLSSSSTAAAAAAVAMPRVGRMSWVTEELYNCNDNLLFVPPPVDDLCVPVNPLERNRYHLDVDDQNAILRYCAQHLPHLFPLFVPTAAATALLPPPPPPPAMTATTEATGAASTPSLPAAAAAQKSGRTVEPNACRNDHDSADTADGPQPRARVDLRRLPGLATSAGPITFEYVEGPRYFESYRVTLRTGSYMVRIQPRGPSPYGRIDIRREYQIMDHLYTAAAAAQIPRTLLYCDSYSVCGRRFFVHRYRDGDVIATIAQLIQPRIRRPVTHSRVAVNVELKPRQFYRVAVLALAALHAAPLPPFMKQQEEQYRRQRTRTHPLLDMVHRCVEHYNIVMDNNRSVLQKASDSSSSSSSSTTTTSNSNNDTNDAGSSSDGRRGGGSNASGGGVARASRTAGSMSTPLSVRSSMVEALARQLVSCFDQTVLSQQMLPPPPQLVVVHGSFSLRSLVFSHRSLEGRAKYPPQLVGTVQFRFAHLGDPLQDVASLALVHFLPPPEGVYGVGKQVHVLFPTANEILDMYCSARGYLLHLDRARREDIFSVYLAAACLHRATIMLAESATVLLTHPQGGLSYADSRNVGLADQLAQRGLQLLARRHQAKV